MNATMIARITARPASAVACMSIIRKRSSRPSPRSPRIVSLRPPSRINAPNAVMIPRDSRPLPGSPPIHCAANTTNPSATAISGTNHLDLATLIEHRLNRGLEESRQRQRERQRWCVAILLDRVDRLTRDAHLRGQLPLREPALAPQLPHRIAHPPRYGLRVRPLARSGPAAGRSPTPERRDNRRLKHHGRPDRVPPMLHDRLTDR